MTCRECTAAIADSLCGDLAAGESEQFEQHLHSCSICWRYVAAYRIAIRLAKGAFPDRDVALADEVPEAVVAAILRARRTMWAN